ncbi:MAG: AraC family transcriptional regulator [Verrucomicrobia bacterium]|nr:AraC family transcriptional regulator [Verrucomicrobiota bacterium]
MSGKVRPICDGEVQLTSHELGWRGLVVEKYGPFESTIGGGILQHSVLLHSVSQGAVLEIQTQQGRIRTELLVGELCIIPGDVSVFIRISNPGDMIAIAIEKYVFSCAGVELGGSSDPEIQLSTRLNDPLLRELSLQMVSQVSQDHGGYVQCLLSAMAAHIVFRYSAVREFVPEISKGLSTHALRKSIQYIHDHFSEDLSTEDIAAQVELNAAYFARMFKRSTGISPHQYLLSCRVNHARILLAQKSVKISEIASASGFYDQSHLTNCFKKVMNMTPSQYSRILVNRDK